MALIDPDGRKRPDRRYWLGLTWKRYDWRSLPREAAVYVICLGAKPLYAGKAADLRKRFWLHQIEAGRICYRPFSGNPADVAVFVHLCDSDLHSELERRIIARLQPPHNIKLLEAAL